MYQVDFDVVYPNFPAFQDGILGDKFLNKNSGAVNVYNDTLVLGNKITKDETNKINEILLKPRSETVIELPIADQSVENKNVITHKQEIIEDVCGSNIVGKVNNGKVVVTILNIPEEDEIIKLNELNKIMYKCEEDYELIKMINNYNENNSIKIN
jgi:hypothetical protein